MTLEATFSELDMRIAQLDWAFDHLLWAIVQGQPAGWSHTVIDHYEETVNDIIGALKDARGTSGASLTMTVPQLDAIHARSALATYQECFNRAWLCYYGNLVIYERKNALYQLRRRGREWAVWVQGVDDALAQCPQPLYEASGTLLRCWQALIEQAGTVLISAQATSFGSGSINVERGAANDRRHEETIAGA